MSRGSSSHTQQLVQGEQRIYTDTETFDQPFAAELAAVPHAEAFHHCPGALVVDLGEGDDPFCNQF